MTLTNDTCVKDSTETQAYKVVNTYANEISGSTIIYRLLHAHTPNLEGMNVDVQSDLSTLALKKGKQLEYFHIRIIRLHQKIIFSGETVSPTRLLYQYIQAFSKRDKLKALIVTNKTYLTTFIRNNNKNRLSTQG